MERNVVKGNPNEDRLQMESEVNKIIQPIGPLSIQCHKIGLSDLDTLIEFIRHLPYGRLRRRADYTDTLAFLTGTCSSKHAFIKAVAQEQGWDFLHLLLVLYRMKEINTPGVGEILLTHELDYIPEAHVVLYDLSRNSFIDSTFLHSSFDAILPDTLICESIQADQIVQYKIEWHKKYLLDWSHNTPYNISQLWKIRETCIRALAM